MTSNRSGPLVSVCIPTYNGAAFLEQTLASVAAQTFEEFEVLIVDDGSSDETIAIAERFQLSRQRGDERGRDSEGVLGHNTR